MQTTLFQSAVSEYASDEARETIKGYRDNVIDEGEKLALERLQRDVSKDTLARFFGDDENQKAEYLRLINEALPHLSIYLK